VGFVSWRRKEREKTKKESEQGAKRGRSVRDAFANKEHLVAVAKRDEGFN